MPGIRLCLAKLSPSKPLRGDRRDLKRWKAKLSLMAMATFWHSCFVGPVRRKELRAPVQLTL
jgi:hypothetical protein